MSDFISQQLESVPGPKKKMGDNSTFIICPYHQEKTPSARVFHDNGYLRCYGCGASKTYSVWSKEYGLLKMGKDRLPENGEVPKNRFLDRLLNSPSSDASSDAESKARMDDLRLSGFDTDTAKKIGVSRKWRGYSTRFLSDVIGARLAFREDIGRHYVWLPVWVRGRLRGFILATLKKPADKSRPSYLNAPGKWSLRYGLFPFDSAVFLMQEKGISTLVVVEGPRDALRLISLGIPAVSMLGTHSWTDIKSKLLELVGVKRLVLMMDGDPAGRKATRFLKTGKRTPSEEPVISPLRTFFKVATIRLWNLEVPSDFPESAYDPGNMPEELLLDLVQPLLR